MLRIAKPAILKHHGSFLGSKFCSSVWVPAFVGSRFWQCQE
jgi:hypothetical protein